MTLRRRAATLLYLIAIAILAVILWRGTEHGEPPCQGCDCVTPIDRPCPYLTRTPTP